MIVTPSYNKHWNHATRWSNHATPMYPNDFGVRYSIIVTFDAIPPPPGGDAGHDHWSNHATPTGPGPNPPKSTWVSGYGRDERRQMQIWSHPRYP